jgi:hypothetical protein
MDPITLFMMANSAVAAVKKGCQLYKDIKGAAGEVKDVLKDLDAQFKKNTEGKVVTYEQKKQFQEEKQRIVELNKSDPGDVYDQIGQELSVYFENMSKCLAIFREEERRSQEVYTGGDSVGKRALQRVLMMSKLEAMGVELRQIMVYECPPELGDLYTRVNAMMEKIGEEQSIAIEKRMRTEHIEAKKKKKQMQQLRMDIALGIGSIIVASSFALSISFVVQDRIEKYPHLGDG